MNEATRGQSQTSSGFKSDREFNAIDVLEEDVGNSEGEVQTQRPLNTTRSASNNSQSYVTQEQLKAAFDEFNLDTLTVLRGNMANTDSSVSVSVLRTPAPQKSVPSHSTLQLPTYNGQRFDAGSDLSSNDEQSDAEENEETSRPEQSDEIPQSRREFLEDLNKSVAIRGITTRPLYTISAKPARQVEKIFQSHRTLKLWDPNTDLRSSMQFVNEFARKVFPYVMQTGDPCMLSFNI